MAEEIVWSAGMDDADFDRASKKMVKTIETLKQKVKDLQDTSAKGSKQNRDVLEKEVISWATLTLKAGMAAVATGAVTRAYTEWASEVNRVRDAHKGLQGELVKTLAASRDLANAKQIENALAGIKGMPISDATKGFGAATAAAPGLSWQDRVGLTKAAAPLVPMGQDVNAHLNLAAKLKQLDPSLSNEDANDLAIVMRERAGEDAARYGSDDFMSSMGRLKTAGLSTEQAISIGMADVESDLPSKGLKKRAEAIYGTNATPGHGPKSKADRLKAEFDKLSAQDRMKRLHSDKEMADAVLGDGGGLALQVAGDTSAQRGAFQSIFGRDLMGEKAAQMKQYTPIPGIKTRTRARTEQMDLTEGEQWAQADSLRESYLTDQRERGAGVYQRFWKNTELWTRQMIASATSGDQVEAVRSGIQGDINFNRGFGKGMPTQADAPAIDAMVKELNTNNKLLAENNKLMQGAGTKKDINRHLEDRQ